MSSFERWSVWLTSVITIVTGAGLLWTKYFVQSSDPWAVVNSPWQPWLLRSHLVVVPLLVFAIGLVTTKHIWRHFRGGVRQGRRSGVLTGLLVFPMIVSGYLIQVVTERGWLESIVIAHILTGAVYTVGLGLHQLATRSRRQQAKQPAGVS